MHLAENAVVPIEILLNLYDHYARGCGVNDDDDHGANDGNRTRVREGYLSLIHI